LEPNPEITLVSLTGISPLNVIGRPLEPLGQMFRTRFNGDGR
jgi:hypothetical protein